MKMKIKLLISAIALAGATQGHADMFQSNDGRADDNHRANKVFVIAM